MGVWVSSFAADGMKKPLESGFLVWFGDLPLCGDFAGGGLAAGVAAVTSQFHGFTRVVTVLAAIFASFLLCAGAGGMCALVLLFFHNSPQISCTLDAPSTLEEHRDS